MGFPPIFDPLRIGFDGQNAIQLFMAPGYGIEHLDKSAVDGAQIALLFAS